MKEHLMPFSGAMVRAIIEGRGDPADAENPAPAQASPGVENHPGQGVADGR